VIKRFADRCGDTIVLFAMNAWIYVRHPVWMARTAIRQRALPNIAVPAKFREKRIWRIIFDRNPLFPLFGDKMAAKTWMIDHAPILSAAPVLWSTKTLEELPRNAFQAGTVVKANSGCNQNLFLRCEPDNVEAIERLIEKWLSSPYRERDGKKYWPNPDQIVFGEAIITSPTGPLIDLNIFCRDGVVDFVVATIGEKTAKERIGYFTPDGDRIGCIMRDQKYARDWLPPDFHVPARYSEAIMAASTLSIGIDFVRVDIISANDNLYACEMTPFPGTGQFDQTAFVKNWARSWDIRSAWFMCQPQRGATERYRKALERQLGRRDSEPA